MSKIREIRVEFELGGTPLVGILCRPEGEDPQIGLVITGPLTSVKEQVGLNYARAMAKRGFAALSFDHRHFGESGGEPRQFESPPEKVRDIQAAVEFLKDDMGLAHVGAVGVCAGAGYMAGAVAQTPEIEAWGAVAGFFHDNAQQRQWMGEGYDAAIDRARAARRSFEESGEVKTIPAVGDGEVAMPMAEAFEYYGTDRGGLGGWKNSFAVMSREHTLPWDAQSFAPKIEVPTMVIHSDNALAPALARKFHEHLAGPAQLAWTTSRGQIDFYDAPELIEPTADKLEVHFRRLTQ